MSSASSEYEFDFDPAPMDDSARNQVRKSRRRRDATQAENQRNDEGDCLADNECIEYDIEENAGSATCGDIVYIKEVLNVPRAKNKSFSDFQVREIERKNSILMNRIISHNRRPSQYRAEPVRLNKVSNSQVNRRKKQAEIDRENMILLKKIQSVKPFGLSKRK